VSLGAVLDHGEGNHYPRQRNQIPLQPGRFLCLFKLEVNLVQVSANSPQQPARADRRQVFIAQTVVPVCQILHTIRLGEKSPAIEWINKNLSGRGLVAADEVSRHPMPATGNRKRRASSR